MEALCKRIAGHQDAMEAFLEKMVNVDSGADSPEGTDIVAHIIGEKLESLGFEVSYPGGPVPQKPQHVLGKRKGNGANPKNVMIIGHLDTVFPKGTAAARPFTKKDGKAFGPGVLDMKSGITIALFALQSLAEENWAEHNIKVMIAGDEENGHPTTNVKELFMEECKGQDAVFNMETGSMAGTVVVGRRGLGFFDLEIEGIAAHSGKDAAKGASAIREVCHKIDELYKMERPDEGVSFNAGKIEGGLVANGIPAHARVWCDLRFTKVESFDYIKDCLEKLGEEVYIPRTKTTMHFNPDAVLMPMEQTEGNMKLYEVVRQQGEKLGIEVNGIFVGAASDSCWPVMVGSPTVCAMGARGEFNHSAEEWMLLSSLTERAQLLALTIQNI